MPVSSIRDRPFYLRSPPRDVRVTNWALRDDPWRSIPAVLVGVAASVVAAVVANDWATGWLAAAAMAAALWRTWLPVTYEFDPRGVTQIVLRRRRAISWLAIGDYELTPRGVLLFPQGEPTWWSAARALFVLWSDQRVEITAIVEYYLGTRLMLEESSRARLLATTQAPAAPPVNPIENGAPRE